MERKSSPVGGVGIWRRPSTTVGLALLMIMGSTTYGILLCELQVSDDRLDDEHAQTAPRTVGEALWLVTITMTTVGFGDLTPVTTVGRVLTLVAALVGIPAQSDGRPCGVADAPFTPLLPVGLWLGGPQHSKGATEPFGVLSAARSVL